MKILVTGGTGFIGSHTVIELLNDGYDVEIIDNLCNSKKTVLDKIESITGKRPVFYEVDLLDKDATDEIIKNGNYDLVIHFAGLKSVSESVREPLKYYENNIISTLNLLESMNRHDVKKIIFSSSATVYGNQDGVKLTEDMPTGIGITNPYGQTKFMIEQILRDYNTANPDSAVTILRYFNPVGNHKSGLIGEDPNGIPNNLMPIIMKVSKREIDKLMIYGGDYDTVDGTGMRDYIHVVDLARGHVAAIKNIDRGVKVYNLGTGKAVSVMEMVKAFEQESNKKLPYEIVERRVGDLGKVYADPSKAERELNWKAEFTINDAMKDTINYLSNEN